MKEKEKIDEIGEILIEGINEVEEPKIKKKLIWIFTIIKPKI